MSNAQNIDLDSSDEEIPNQDFNFDIYIKQTTIMNNTIEYTSIQNINNKKFFL